MARSVFSSLFLVLLVLPAAHAAKPAEPAAWVELGSINVEHGLALLNGADGQNEAALVGGSKCRRNLPDSRFLYFDYDVGAGRLRRPVYITVEYFDEGFGTIQIQYDSSDLDAPERGAYKDGATELLLDSRRWRKAVFELIDARFDGRQNLGADFRLALSRTAVIRKVSIQMERSPEFERQFRSQRERVAASAGKLDPPKGVQVVFSGPDISSASDAGQAISDMLILAPMLKALGTTSVRTRVRWSVAEPARGRWDWSFFDGIVSVLRENKLKWSPLIEMGSAESTPKWFLDSKESVQARCIEHNELSGNQSIWNPAFPAVVERFMAAFYEHYGSTNTIESVLVDVIPDWEADPGLHHAHSGHWFGDDYARADFGHYLQHHYGDIWTLNEAWGANHIGFEEIAPFVPQSGRSARARLDLAQWHQERAADWSRRCLAAVRKYCPRTALYLVIDGTNHPSYSVDPPLLCKTVAEFDAGVHVRTPCGSFAEQFACTSSVTAAARHYGAYYSFAATGDAPVTALPARLYNTVASKARGIVTGHPTVLSQPGGIAAWSGVYRWLDADGARRPGVAVLFPETSSLIDGSGDFAARALLARDAFDFDLVTEPMIRDGILKRYKALVLLECQRIERKDVDLLLDWIAGGGIVIGGGFGGFTPVEGGDSLLPGVFDLSLDQSPSIKSHAAGFSVWTHSDWSQPESAVAAIGRVLRSLSTHVRANLLPDGAVDGIYVTDVAGRLLVYNSTETDAEREFEVSIGRRKSAKLPAGDITELKY